MYFDQKTGAPHIICWSKSIFWCWNNFCLMCKIIQKNITFPSGVNQLLGVNQRLRVTPKCLETPMKNINQCNSSLIHCPSYHNKSISLKTLFYFKVRFHYFCVCVNLTTTIHHLLVKIHNTLSPLQTIILSYGSTLEECLVPLRLDC